MSLFSSLTTAITGLNAQQEAIANISDNISNAQTIGFKEVNTTFQNLVTSSTPTLNQPGGVTALPLYDNSTAGNLTPSNVTTNLAISGQGFFQVKAPPAAVPAGQSPTFSEQNLYTQAGDFQLNAQGFLVNSAGYFLTGYQVNPQTQVVNTAATVPIQVSQLVDAPEATANVSLAANVPSTFPFQNMPTPPGGLNPAYVAPSPITIQVFDATGAAHNETVQFNHPDPANPNVWTATIQDVPPDAAGNNNNAISAGTAGNPATDEPVVLQLTFSDGQNATPPLTQVLPAGTLTNITNITPGSSPTLPAAPPGATVPNVSVTTPANGGPATFSIAQDFGAGPQPINFSFGSYGSSSGVTQFTSPQNTVTEGSSSQDGVPVGDFENLSINADGLVNLNYTNGQTLTFFQIPIAQFNAPDQLQRLQGAAFSSTIDSGAASLNQPGVNGAGTIAPSTLEQSNVDIATQFTQLITAQQVYSANSKVITTADQLLTTVIALIQG
ncbi:MAG: flagellar hook-basal body complex protein [Aliidongia sp.]